ncbi:MAG: exo-alpha-sialidase [Chloroflexi bacterium]|nr:exo-alpha-sialidase [Chloroflexota bacterium]
MRQNVTSSSSIRIRDRVRTYFMDFGDIVFAESADGRDLSRTTSTNIRGTRTPGSADAFVSNPAVLQRDDGKLLMVYESSAESPPNQRDRRLYARVSDDGITFGSAVRLPDSALDRSLNGGIFQSVPDLIRLADGSFRLYYVAGGVSTASMRSADGGLTWMPEAGYRLAGVNGRSAYVDPDAVLQPDGSLLMYLAYSEFEPRCGGLGCQRFRLAHSPDGLTFTIDQEDLLVPPAGVPGLVDPDVYQATDGRWYMLYGEITTGQTINLKAAVRTD